MIRLFAMSPMAAQGNGPSLRREKMTREEAERMVPEEEIVTIETGLGALRGVQRDGYREFRGVRFAVSRRWEEAVPVTEGWEGVYDATRWGDRSLQFRGFYGMENNVSNQYYADEALISLPAKYSEDSLNLNIWAPDGGGNCPVLVYIHGGALVSGSNTDTSTDGEAYARRGIVMVAINYRLGPFANVYGDGAEGNLTLTDQITALRWIRDNIADYGGDPAKITVMGESAGAASVQNMLISPLVEDGLIAGAIMLSGGGHLRSVGTPATTAVQELIWGKVKEHFGVERMSELRSVPDKELFEGWAGCLGENRLLATTPILNGVSLVEDVGYALEHNTIKDVPTMFGMLSQDMFPHSLYLAAMQYGKKRAEAGGKPAYMYYFDRVQPGDTTFGAFHAADLYYVFGTLYRNWRPFDEIDFRIAENMVNYIANFVKTGDPNGGGLPRWESATAAEQLFMHFGDEEAAMIAPDGEMLAHTQATCPPFPFAAAVKTPDEGVADGSV